MRNIHPVRRECACLWNIHPAELDTALNPVYNQIISFTVHFFSLQNAPAGHHSWGLARERRGGIYEKNKDHMYYGPEQ